MQHAFTVRGALHDVGFALEGGVHVEQNSPFCRSAAQPFAPTGPVPGPASPVAMMGFELLQPGTAMRAEPRTIAKRASFFIRLSE